MAYTYPRQKQIEQIIAACRPEVDDLDFWAEQIRQGVSVEDLEQHCLFLTSRMDELMEETSSGNLSMGSVEHSLELAKLAEVANHLDAVELALGRD